MDHLTTESRPRTLHAPPKTKSARATGARRDAKTNTVVESRCVTDEVGFLSLRAEWNELVDRSPVHIYQTFDWQWFWWKHYGGHHRLYIVTFRSEGRLVGIIPMFLHSLTIAGRTIYTRLRMIGCGVDSHENIGLPSEYGPSDYLDAILLPEYASEIAEMFAAMISMGGGGVFDEVQCQNSPYNGFIQKYFVPAAAAQGLTPVVREQERCPFVSLPGTFPEFLEHLRPSTRYRIRQAKKEFGGTTPFSVESVVHRSTLDHAFQDMICLHQTRWNSLGYAGLFSDRRYCAFQRDVVHSFYDQGYLWFKAITMGGIRTAARIGFFFKGRVYDYLSGFDDTLPGAKKRPSLALLIEMIGDAIEHEAGIVDFLRGQEAYKFELTNEAMRIADIRIIAEESTSSVRRFLFRILRSGGIVMRRCAAEWKLLMIQKQMKGNRLFLWTYAKFVTARTIAAIFKNDTARKEGSK